MAWQGPGTILWYFLDHEVCQSDGSPQRKGCVHKTIFNHHEYSSRVLCGTLKRHMWLRNSFGAKMLGLQGSIWQYFQCAWTLGNLPQDAKSSETCGITKWIF